MIRIAAVFVLLAVAAQANPPPVGSADWNELHEFSPWIEQQYSVYGLCCSVADARVPQRDELRVVDGRRQVLWSRRHWDDAPEEPRWLDIPSDAVLPGTSPTGGTIVWVYRGAVRCAIFGGAV